MDIKSMGSSALARSGDPSYASRRRFLGGVSGAALLAGVGWGATSAALAREMPRIGYLSVCYPHSGTSGTPLLQQAFLSGLADHGYLPGRNVTVDYRYADWNLGRLTPMALELAGLPVDIIVAADSLAARAAAEVTKTLPIVVSVANDLVRQGLAANLMQPGGNVSGLTNRSHDLGSERLRLLSEVLPGLTRVAVLWNAEHAGAELVVHAVREAAVAVSMELQPLGFHKTSDLQAAFVSARAADAQALLIVPDPLTVTNHQRISRLALQSRLPALHGVKEFVTADGLMAYGPDRHEMMRRVGGYVDRLLKGGDIAAMPVQGPIQFELDLNARTARALGLTLSPTLLARANTVIA